MCGYGGMSTMTTDHRDQRPRRIGIIFGGGFISLAPPLESSCRRESNLLDCLAHIGHSHIR